MIIEEAIKALISGQRLGTPDPHNWGQNQLTSFAEFGTTLSTGIHTLTSEQVHKRFDDLREWIQLVSGTQRLNAVYLDTTTIHTARSLIFDREGDEGALPPTLLDLSTFVNSVVLFDRIFYLENSKIDSSELNEALGNEPIVISLPVKSFGFSHDGDPLNSVGGMLRGIWYETNLYINELRDAHVQQEQHDPLFEDAKEIKKAWRSIIDFRDDDDLWFDPNGSVKNASFNTDGPNLLNDLIETYYQTGTEALYNQFRTSNEGHQLTEFVHRVIDECNYRCLFNLRVSNSLQLYYIPNSFRLPFRNFSYKKAKVLQRYLPSIRAIEKEYSNLAELYSDSDQNNLRLPFFLAAVLNQISTLDDFFGVLAETRKKATDFRNHRAELDDALERGSVKEVKKLRKALQGDSDNLRFKFPLAPIAGGIAAVLAAFTGEFTYYALATIGILTAGSQFSPYHERLKERALKRQFWFLTDMKDAADGLTISYPLIRDLWKLDEYNPKMFSQEAFAKQFAKLKALSY